MEKLTKEVVFFFFFSSRPGSGVKHSAPPSACQVDEQNIRNQQNVLDSHADGDHNGGQNIDRRRVVSQRCVPNARFNKFDAARAIGWRSIAKDAAA